LALAAFRGLAVMFLSEASSSLRLASLPIFLNFMMIQDTAPNQENTTLKPMTMLQLISITHSLPLTQDHQVSQLLFLADSWALELE
jgi:hypothetical protein